MTKPGVVPFDPLSNGGASFGETAEVVQPYALLLETPKQALDGALLRGRVRCNDIPPLLKSPKFNEPDPLTTVHSDQFVGCRPIAAGQGP